MRLRFLFGRLDFRRGGGFGLRRGRFGFCFGNDRRLRFGRGRFLDIGHLARAEIAVERLLRARALAVLVADIAAVGQHAAGLLLVGAQGVEHRVELLARVGRDGLDEGLDAALQVAVQKIAGAYGIPYYRMESNEDIMGDTIEKVLAEDSFAMCEVFVDINQKFEPKSATKRLEDGTLVSPPLEDLAPFLPREELEKIMLIPMWEESSH